MSFRGPTGKFFYDEDHDVHPHCFYLERNMWDEAKGDLVLDWRGNMVLDGGWEAVAADMTARFGREFTPSSVRERLNKIVMDDARIDDLFGKAVDLRERMDRAAFRKAARAWFTEGRSAPCGPGSSPRTARPGPDRSG